MEFEKLQGIIAEVLNVDADERSSTSCPASFAPFAHSFASISELLPPRRLVDMINTFFAMIKFLLFQCLF